MLEQDAILQNGTGIMGLEADEDYRVKQRERENAEGWLIRDRERLLQVLTLTHAHPPTHAVLREMTGQGDEARKGNQKNLEEYIATFHLQ